MKTIKFFSIFILIATLCVFIPSFAMAGAGIEPGGSCGIEGVKFDTPPLMGEVIFSLSNEGELVATGILERKGNNGCAVPVSIILGAVTLEEFNELTAEDIKNWCLDEIMGIGAECEGLRDEQPYEVIAVGGFKRLDPPQDAYSARLIIMPLQ